MEKRIIEIKKEMDNVSPSFCAAKWFQTTLYLQTGWNHSCHHPAPHKIPLEEIKSNPKALHNTQFKKEQMQKMLNGERPEECDYCWNIEDLGHTSDRTYKTAADWCGKISDAKQHGTNDIAPTYLEISFSHVCNFKCAYCSPDVSSKWLEEVEQYGPYPTSMPLGDVEYLKSTARYPIPHKDYNPYVEAFWKWWPELSPGLKTLRVTGGEPLLSKDAWKLFDKIVDSDNEYADLEFGINTNLDVPDQIFEKFIDIVPKIAKKVRVIRIFTSNEAKGKQAEYIRFGLNYNKWYSNLDKVIPLLPSNVTITIMTTINILSLSTLVDFFEDVMDLRKKHSTSYETNNPFMSINYLRWPPHLHAALATDDVKKDLVKKLKNFTSKYKSGVYHLEKHYAFLNYDEKVHIDMLCDLLDKTQIPVIDNEDRPDFVKFVDEYDRRKGTNFSETFPELLDLYNRYKNV